MIVVFQESLDLLDDSCTSQIVVIDDDDDDVVPTTADATNATSRTELNVPSVPILGQPLQPPFIVAPSLYYLPAPLHVENIIIVQDDINVMSVESSNPGLVDVNIKEEPVENVVTKVNDNEDPLCVVSCVVGAAGESGGHQYNNEKCPLIKPPSPAVKVVDIPVKLPLRNGDKVDWEDKIPMEVISTVVSIEPLDEFILF